MNSENSKSSMPLVLMLNLNDKMEEVKKVLICLILVFMIHGKA